MSLYRELRAAIDWFRAEWQADMPAKLHETATHVDDSDHLGGPRMTDRFRDYIDSGVMWMENDEGALAPVRLDGARGRIRPELTNMAHSGSLLERHAARYLFVLACQDFDPERAGILMSPPLTAEYAYYYAEKAITRIAQRIVQGERKSRLPWQMSRRYRELPPSQEATRAVA